MSTLKFIIGNNKDGDLQQVDIWLGNIHLTPIDNMAYLPQFLGSLVYEFEQLKLRKINSDGFFLNLGPTTDDYSCRIKINDDIAQLSVDRDDGDIQFFEFNIDELEGIYQRVIRDLESIRKNSAFI